MVLSALQGVGDGFTLAELGGAHIQHLVDHNALNVRAIVDFCQLRPEVSATLVTKIGNSSQLERHFKKFFLSAVWLLPANQRPKIHPV